MSYLYLINYIKIIPFLLVGNNLEYNENMVLIFVYDYLLIIIINGWSLWVLNILFMYEVYVKIIYATGILENGNYIIHAWWLA